MTLEERAKEFVSKIASGTSQEMDYYANLLVEFANETTKELQEDLKHKKIAIQTRKARIKDLEQEKCELLGIIQGKDTAIQDLQKKNKILTKALNLYINWADECGIGWDNFPDMSEKWYKTVEEKGLGWIEGLTFMVMEEAKEQLRK